MRIAQVAPLQESVPPRLYGGTERVVSYLTEELARLGHQVTLFATGDSQTVAHLISSRPRSLHADTEVVESLAHYILMLEQVFKHAREFDLIHFHIDYLHFPFSRRLPTPHLTTLHRRLNVPDLALLFQEFADIPVVSVSDAQRAPLPWLKWQGTVYHGLPKDLYAFHPEPGSYLAFLGRMSPEKGPDQAIQIARRAGLPIRLAARVESEDGEYFEQVIRPLLADPAVEFVGEIAEHEKEDFLGNALALLFPIDWPEPFGLPLIEALACGTPVVAYRNGSVPEIIQDGRTGFVVEDPAAGAQAIQGLTRPMRRRSREAFEQRFTVSRMAAEYVRLYEQLRGAGALPNGERQNGHRLEWYGSDSNGTVLLHSGR